MLSRRELVGGACTLVLAGTAASRSAPRAYVCRSGTGFARGGVPYRIAGTNMWYAAYLGAEQPIGNRERLKRELDRLAAIGVNNIRVLGSSELSPLKNSIRPAFTHLDRPNDALFEGLDYALAEMGKRRMTAVIYLTNFWEWSGGMMTYLYWTNGGRYIDMNDPAHPWPAFADMSSDFYGSAPAVRMYERFVRTLVSRRNAITGELYRDDPTIMSWQLANEPRPGGSPGAALRHMSAYLLWIRRTAGLIKAIDRNHLVSTGSEGTQGCADDDDCLADAHKSGAIDYVTAHVWPQNWGWADPADLSGTWAQTEHKVRAYLDRQMNVAQRLGKPLVVEEFGFPRDGGSLDPASTTEFRDRFYALVYEIVAASVRCQSALQGANFWAWGGEGRAEHPDRRFSRGDTSYLGDPPHEPQGWYSMFDTDRSTKALVTTFAADVRAMR